jgi:hypothetical protein
MVLSPLERHSDDGVRVRKGRAIRVSLHIFNRPCLQPCVSSPGIAFAVFGC